MYAIRGYSQEKEGERSRPGVYETGRARQPNKAKSTKLFKWHICIRANACSQFNEDDDDGDSDIYKSIISTVNSINDVIRLTTPTKTTTDRLKSSVGGI